MRPGWYVLVFIVVILALVFTAWFTTTCAEAHGGHWWCWLG